MKTKITLGEKYGPAMKMTDNREADAYFEECVQNTMERTSASRSEAEAIERSNLGYWAGYYDHETRVRVERLFGCIHPVFGSADAGPVSAEEAFRKGIACGRRQRAAATAQLSPS